MAPGPQRSMGRGISRACVALGVSCIAAKLAWIPLELRQRGRGACAARVQRGARVRFSDTVFRTRCLRPIGGVSLNWQITARNLARLFARPQDLSAGAEGRVRVDAAAVLAPFVDLTAFFAAVGLGASVNRGQIIGFLLAAALNLGPLLRAQIPRHGLRPPALHLLAMTLMAFFLRSGLFALLINGWGWPAHAAIGFAVIVAAAVMRAGCAYCAADSSLRLGSGVNWQAGALGLVLCAWLLRLIYAGQIELLPEEPYYWNYSRHLDIGYLDHPPMVAWLIRVGTAVFGDTEFGVRIGALCSSGVAAFFAYHLTRNLFGEPSAWVAVVLMQTLPFFFLSGLLITP